MSFLIKLIVKGGSGDPETSRGYAAIVLDWWVTHDASSSALFYSPCTYDVIVVFNLYSSVLAGILGLVLWRYIDKTELN